MKAVIALILLPIVEFFLLQTGLGSVFFALLLYLFVARKFSWLTVITLIILSLINDIMLHVFIGSCLLSGVAGLAVLYLISLFVPIVDGPVRIIELVVSILISFITLGLLTTSSGFNDLSGLIVNNFGTMIRLTIFTTVWFFVVEVIMNGIWGSSSSDIKLKNR